MREIKQDTECFIPESKPEPSEYGYRRLSLRLPVLYDSVESGRC
jgi:hypothetical protein